MTILYMVMATIIKNTIKAEGKVILSGMSVFFRSVTATVIRIVIRNAGHSFS